MDKLQELYAKREAIAKPLAEMFEEHKDLDLTEEQVHEIQVKNKELAALVEQIKPLEETKSVLEDAKRLHDQYTAPSVNYGHADSIAPAADTKTLGEMFVESRAYKRYTSGDIDGKEFKVEFPTYDPALNLKTLTETVNYVPVNVRSDKVVPYPLQPVRLMDVLPSYTTTNQITKWMQETAPTDNSGAPGEATAPSESVLTYAERTATIEKVSSFLTVSQEQLDDVPNITNLINTRLRALHAAKEEYLILNNSGSNYKGFLQLSTGATHTTMQTLAKGADPAPDALFKAMTKIRTGTYSIGAEPTAFVFHPNDWQDIQLLRTIDGVYIWGSPASQVGNPQMWGLPVIQTTYCTENTTLVGDFAMHCRVARRQGIELATSDSHSTNFTANIITIKTTSRLALEVYLLPAFCTVTGM